MRWRRGAQTPGGRPVVTEEAERASPGTRLMSITTAGRDLPRVHHPHEALAAREHARLVAVLGEEVERLVEVRGAA